MAIEIRCMDCEKSYLAGVENTSVIESSPSIAIIKTTCPRCKESSQKEIKNPYDFELTKKPDINNNVFLDRTRFMHQYMLIAKTAIIEKLHNFSLLYTCDIWNPLASQGKHSMNSLVIRNNKRKIDIAIIRTSDRHQGYVILDVYKENIDKLTKKEKKELEGFLSYISKYFGLVCPYFVR